MITRVHLQPNGDAAFPAIDLAAWQEVERSEHAAGPEDAASFSLSIYRRRLGDAGAMV